MALKPLRRVAQDGDRPDPILSFNTPAGWENC
jgi:hypothetical protein